MSSIESKDLDLFEKLADEPVTKDKLLRDDEILSEADKKKPDVSCKPASETNKPKKPCANCTCGLAEELEKEARDKTAENSTAGKSSCGSCYLGDAFRCASCPYRGMPAFKPGEKVLLDTGTDDL